MFLNKIILFFSSLIILYTDAFDNCVNNSRIIEKNILNYNTSFFGLQLNCYNDLSFLENAIDYNLNNQLCNKWIFIWLFFIHVLQSSSYFKKYKFSVFLFQFSFIYFIF